RGGGALCNQSGGVRAAVGRPDFLPVRVRPPPLPRPRIAPPWSRGAASRRSGGVLVGSPHGVQRPLLLDRLGARLGRPRDRRAQAPPPGLSLVRGLRWDLRLRDPAVARAASGGPGKGSTAIPDAR